MSMSKLSPLVLVPANDIVLPGEVNVVPITSATALEQQHQGKRLVSYDRPSKAAASAHDVTKVFLMQKERTDLSMPDPQRPRSVVSFGREAFGNSDSCDD